jgi:hypothetical protein
MLQAIAAKAAPYVASHAIPWILNRISGNPQRKKYEEFVQQQQPMLDLLRKQAMGGETPASRFITGRIEQAGQRSKLATAASATRQGVGRQSAAAGQQRISGQYDQITADALAQLQAGAQAQYSGAMGQVGRMQAGLAGIEMQAQATLAENLGRMIQEISRDVDDDWLKQVKGWFQQFENDIPGLAEMFAGQLPTSTATIGSTISPRTGGNLNTTVNPYLDTRLR